MADAASDATLLKRFVSDREEAAFVTLVRRHGPRVERICRRILRNEHDVEDVFQATFFVLARKAAATPWRENVSPWIDDVARRLALHARSGAARQNGRERTITALIGASTGSGGRLPDQYHPLVQPAVDVEWCDLRRVLDDELERLPEKYRAPVILCDLEGHTREEAARRLGWPAGSMSRRLDRARSLLRQRLTHRGLVLATVGVIAVAAAIGSRIDQGQRGLTVRQVMAPFRAASAGGHDYGPILAAAARADAPQTDFARILPAARAAVVASRQLERPGTEPRVSIWNQLARDLGRSASDMEAACREPNPAVLVAAARRVQAACLSCHAVFGQGPDPARATIDQAAGIREWLTPAPPAGRPLTPRATNGSNGTRKPASDAVIHPEAPYAERVATFLIPAVSRAYAHRSRRRDVADSDSYTDLPAWPPIGCFDRTRSSAVLADDPIGSVIADRRQMARWRSSV